MDLPRLEDVSERLEVPGWNYQAFNTESLIGYCDRRRGGTWRPRRVQHALVALLARRHNQPDEALAAARWILCSVETPFDDAGQNLLVLKAGAWGATRERIFASAAISAISAWMPHGDAMPPRVRL
ncbi:hypothetical protein ON010_g18856 [Phytophthora cinnamomi]|nr:hypothetical protein ON010_g18856 [Phytophthora cinnamomi]